MQVLRLPSLELPGDMHTHILKKKMEHLAMQTKCLEPVATTALLELWIKTEACTLCMNQSLYKNSYLLDQSHVPIVTQLSILWNF